MILNMGSTHVEKETEDSLHKSLQKLRDFAYTYTIFLYKKKFHDFRIKTDQELKLMIDILRFKRRELLDESHPGVFQVITLPLFRAF